MSEDLIFAENSVSEGLYKFRSYESTIDIDRVKSLLSGELYFSNCVQMNDPFEMRARLSLEENPRLRKQRLMKTFNAVQKQQGIAIKDRLRLSNQRINQLERDPDKTLRNAERKHYDRMQTECVAYCMQIVTKDSVLALTIL